MTKRTAIAATILSPVAVLALAVLAMPGRQADPAEIVTISTAIVDYREPGQFLQDGAPVNGPLREIMPQRPFEIMKRQVTRGEYDRCVASGACRGIADAGDPDLPLVGVSYDDAVDYATWLTAETGYRYRLPTDREWALAAGSRYVDDAYTEISDPKNPSKRWLATYEAESAKTERIEARPQPVGHFGENENGLQDVAGNIWEWTSTCFVRHATDPETGRTTHHENCGVRIAQGAHRAYMTSFFRDAKAGACSVGVPPANLGIRFVREEPSLVARLQGFLDRVGGRLPG